MHHGNYTETMQPATLRNKLAFGCLSLFGAFCLQLGAADTDPMSIGPAVGTQAPDFELTDQHGNARDFESLTGDNGLLLLFFRSADW